MIFPFTRNFVVALRILSAHAYSYSQKLEPYHSVSTPHLRLNWPTWFIICSFFINYFIPSILKLARYPTSITFTPPKNDMDCCFEAKKIAHQFRHNTTFKCLILLTCKASQNPLLTSQNLTEHMFHLQIHQKLFESNKP